MKIVGAVSNVPGRAQVLGRCLADETSRGPQSIVDLLHSDARVALFTIRRPEETHDNLVTGTSSDGRDRFWFAGEWIESRDQVTPVVGDVHDTIGRLHASLEGGFLGVCIDPAQGVTLLSDSWGLCWTFVRQLSDATVFGCDFAAVCRAGGQPPSPDRDSVLLELSTGFSPDHRTVFHRVEVVPPGSTMCIDTTGSRLLSRRTFAYGDRWVCAASKEKFEALDGHLDRIGKRIARLAGGRAAISLSAGYDSRYALAVLSDAGAVGKLLTFGEADSDEVMEARAVAMRHAEPPDWEDFRVPETNWTAWTRMIQSLGNAGIVQWCGWADDWLAFVRQHSNSCAIGYLGDALSGKRFDVLHHQDRLAGELDRGVGQWTRRWIAFELDMGEWAQSQLLRAHARRDLLRIAAERFGGLAAQATYAGDYQQALHCNLVGRQRRWVATQPALMCSHVRPLTFFVDKAYRDFWMNVGLEDLLGQSLYLQYAESRFPRFFPKSPGAARQLAQRVSRKLRREIASVLGRPPEIRRPPPIVRAKLLGPHYPHIRKALESAAPWLDDIVDVAAMRQAVDAHADGRSDPRLTSGMLFRCVNVMHLLALRAGSSIDAS